MGVLAKVPKGDFSNGYIVSTPLVNLLWFGSHFVPSILSFCVQTYETTPSMCSYKSNFALVKVWGNFTNHDPVREWASILCEIILVIKYTINYGPIHEWAFIFAKQLWVVKYSASYWSIREWIFIVTKLLWAVKCNTNYGPIRDWASNLRKLRVVLRLLHSTFEVTLLMMNSYMNGHLYLPKYFWY